MHTRAKRIILPLGAVLTATGVIGATLTSSAGATAKPSPGECLPRLQQVEGERHREVLERLRRQAAQGRHALLQRLLHQGQGQVRRERRRSRRQDRHRAAHRGGEDHPHQGEERQPAESPRQGVLPRSRQAVLVFRLVGPGEVPQPGRDRRSLRLRHRRQPRHPRPLGLRPRLLPGQGPLRHLRRQVGLHALRLRQLRGLRQRLRVRHRLQRHHPGDLEGRRSPGRQCRRSGLRVEPEDRPAGLRVRLPGRPAPRRRSVPSPATRPSGATARPRRPPSPPPTRPRRRSR